MSSGRYGHFALQRGDSDAAYRWGGQVQSQLAMSRPALVAPGGVVTPNALPPPRYVRTLQEDLRELGFKVVGNPTGVFDLHTEWGVREFQLHAKMTHLAKEDTLISTVHYIDRLSQVANGLPYAGPVSGVVNQGTADRIEHWLLDDNEWRCPVVIQAMRVHANAPTTPAAENLWHHTDETNATYRIYARDFSRYYAMPAGHGDDDLHVLATYTPEDFGGGVSEAPRHTWPQAELSPDTLVGVAYAAMTPAQRSTFKAVRAVAEQECMGFYDSLTAYDRAFISQGPCHWTLGLVNRNTHTVEGEGELCGFWAYLRYSDAATAASVLEYFGVRVDEDWANGGGSGYGLWVNDQKKYQGWPALQTEGGGYTRMGFTEAEGNWFKTWHWFYRLSMAGRTIVGYQRAMWAMARIRIRDVRGALWGQGVANVGTRPATIGDVFTSEKAVALIHRWHVYTPGPVVDANRAGPRLRAVLARAVAASPALAWDGDPSGWTNAHEAALLRAMRVEINTIGGNLDTTADAVDAWPGWLGPGQPNPRRYALALPAGTSLAEARNSFVFDGTGLPPPPP